MCECKKESDYIEMALQELDNGYSPIPSERHEALSASQIYAILAAVEKLQVIAEAFRESVTQLTTIEERLDQIANR